MPRCCVPVQQHVVLVVCEQVGGEGPRATDGRASLSTGPCMNAKKLSGSWKAFDLTAVPIDATDPATGGPQHPALVFCCLPHLHA